jgi:acetyl esterase/lipase
MGPPVSLLELAYAGWLQRIRPTSVHQTPTATLAIIGGEDAPPQSNTDSPAIDGQVADPAITTAALSLDLSTAAVDQVAAPQLTVTGPPSFLDQLNVFTMRLQRFTDQIVGGVLKVIGSLIGVDLYTPWNNSRDACTQCSDTPPSSATTGLTVSQANYSGGKVWVFTPPNPSGNYVVAIHGGGFSLQPDLPHWIDYTSMARETGATVIVPIYPLEQDGGKAVDVVPDMADFIASQVAAHPGKVSVYGDSSGATIALSAVQLLVADGRGLPSSMVLLSPGVDFTMNNPKINLIDDPVFQYQDLWDRFQGWSWDDGVDLTDPLVSPLYGNFAGFPSTTIYVGSLEYFAPDVVLLYQKGVAQGAPISVVVGQGQIHDWPLGGLAMNSQAPVARPSIYAQLGLAR